MTALLVTQADRLRERFKLTRAECDILVSVLSVEGIAPRKAVRADDSRSFDVLLTRLNQKLPATVRVVPRYEGDERWKKGVTFDKGGSTKAIGYSISNDWARDQLLRVARGSSRRRAA